MKNINYKTLVLLKTHATVKYLIHVQSSVEDTLGSLDSNQRLTSMFRLRAAILMSLSIKNTAHGGNAIDVHEIDQIDYDPINLISGEDMTDASGQLHRFCKAVTDKEVKNWQKQFLDYIHTFEKILEYEADLPDARSPNGFQFIISLFKDWDPLLEKLGYPTSIPSDWFAKKKEE
jgi:hypothetical protein